MARKKQNLLREGQKNFFFLVLELLFHKKYINYKNIIKSFIRI